jgi:TetR/AcrR family transcriptional regulator, cholesterol catabolism regulator
MDIRTRVIEGAADLFLKQGIRALTMNEIAQSLGISKRTLYEHFSNKEDLLSGCLDFWNQESCRMTEEIKAVSTNPLELIHKHFREAVIRLGSVHPNLVSDIRKYHPALWKRQYQEIQKNRLTFTSEFLEQGIRDGFFRPDFNIEITAKLLFAQVDLLYDTELFPENRFSKADVFREIIFGFIRGICTEKGLKEMERIFETTNY